MELLETNEEGLYPQPQLEGDGGVTVVSDLISQSVWALQLLQSNYIPYLKGKIVHGENLRQVACHHLLLLGGSL